MTKIRRNDPCSCGSGKKYKRCCLPLLEANRGQNPQQVRQQAQANIPKTKDILRRLQQNQQELIELTDRSNAVIDLIHDNKLAQAETDAKKLLEDFPDDHDALELLAWVHEKKGDKNEASKFYQMAIELAQKHSLSENNEHLKWLQQRADNLNNPIKS